MVGVMRRFLLGLVCALSVTAGAHAQHTADQNGDFSVNIDELLRVIQFYNTLAFHCEVGTEDNYAPGVGATDCATHDSDYAPQDWSVSLDELLRVIQFYNSLGYYFCPDDQTEDGFCPGVLQ